MHVIPAKPRQFAYAKPGVDCHVHERSVGLWNQNYEFLELFGIEVRLGSSSASTFRWQKDTPEKLLERRIEEKKQEIINALQEGREFVLDRDRGIVIKRAS